MQNLAVAFGILVLTAFGAGVTEISLAAGRQTADQPVRPAPRASVTPTPSARPTPTPSPEAALAPSPSPAGPALPTALTNGFVHMRAGTSTSTAIITGLQAGTTVELTGKAIGLWQPVLYHGLNGYIYTPYLNY